MNYNPMPPEKRHSRRNIHGQWLIRLREGTAASRPPNNHYLLEAVGLQEMLYTLPELEKGFSAMFDDMSRPLVLDVGCYFGDTVVELALYNPGINVLGLDVKYKRVVKSCRKIKRTRLNNAKIAICNIQELIPLLPAHSVTGVFVFFPDPWRKSRHEKHRFLNRSFFNEISVRLTGEGFIWLKTDHPEYFEESKTAAETCGFTAISRLPGTNVVHRQYKTLFEDLFNKQNIPTYEIILS
jgi:tRNA (guanine-N7-)-methyltransferase